MYFDELPNVKRPGQAQVGAGAQNPLAMVHVVAPRESGGSVWPLGTKEIGHRERNTQNAALAQPTSGFHRVALKSTAFVAPSLPVENMGAIRSSEESPASAASSAEAPPPAASHWALEPGGDLCGLVDGDRDGDRGRRSSRYRRPWSSRCRCEFSASIASSTSASK